jgi:hypothetical protein
MTNSVNSTLLALSTLLAVSPAIAQDTKQTCPMHQAPTKETEHSAAVNARGDHAMGFSHAKTTHHFYLYADGGAIEVLANDTEDSASRDEIRKHLNHIAQMFAAGNFDAPLFIHDQVPPGVPGMQQHKAEISYRYTDVPRGGLVRILTKNADGLAAIHQFLRFQISDHQTGDSTAVTSAPR